VAVTLPSGPDAYHQSWGAEYVGAVGTAGSGGSGAGIYDTVQEFQLDSTKGMVKCD
jgi:hypothetical protein